MPRDHDKETPLILAAKEGLYAARALGPQFALISLSLSLSFLALFRVVNPQPISLTSL